MKDGWLKQNQGITLIEILVVAAVLSILVGTAGISISLINSRDAEKCAKLINVSMESVRMSSMSQKGTFRLILNTTSNSLEEVSSESGVVQTQSLPSQVMIVLESEGVTNISGSDTLIIEFDKSTGKVKSIHVNSGAADVNLVKIKISNSAGKTASVSLAAATGKHFVEYGS